jgi:putative ABC transport system permease protein
LETVWQDLRFGVRMLRQSPLTTGLALLILALGIGANTAIFSVVRSVLLEPLPYPRPERLMIVLDHAPRHGFDRLEVAAPNYRDWREQNRSFATLDAYYADRFVLTGGARPAVARGARVTGELFRTLGVKPAQGRLLRPEDDRPGTEPVAVLSYDLWRSQLGGDPGAVGRRIQVDGRDRTVIGVAEPGFRFPDRSALWVPFALDFAKERRGAHSLTVLGRLRPGVTPRQAQADLSAVAARLEGQYPDTNEGWGVRIEPLHQFLVAGVRPTLVLLERAVGLVLLIACANVASLLLVRTAARRRELAVRAALGAGRMRLARQLLIECAVLFMAGGGLGAALAWPAARALTAIDPDAIPYAAAGRIDHRVLLYTLALSLATGLLVGLVPAVSAAGVHLYAALQEGGRAMAGGRTGRWVRSGLVAGEVALAVTLLVAAGLLLHSFALLRSVHPGFEPRGVLTAALSPPAGRYSEERRAQLFEQLPERVRALPGVESAAVVYPLPLSGEAYVQPFAVEGRPKLAPADEPRAQVFIISPDYFAALGAPVLAGRAFTAQDRQGGQPVVIVNRTLARQIWPGESPLGRRISFDLAAGLKARSMTVVGVVGDVRALALHEEPMPQAYWPQLQRPLNSAVLLLRAVRPEATQAMVEPLRRAVRSVDHDVVLDSVQPLTAVVAASIAANRVKTLLVGGFGALALVLAAVGIYGLVSDTVARRTHEIGIRMALGAGRAQVRGMVIRQGMALVAAGLAAGLAVAWAAVRLMNDPLYGVSAADPATYAGVPLLLATVALAAHWLPARRATRVDPLAALRAE